jgi:peptide/nickel transport system permease protein
MEGIRRARAIVVRSWAAWGLRKAARLATLLAAISILTYALINMSPIDPVQAYIGSDMMLVGPEQRQAIAEYWGLNQPLWERYMRWASAFLSGDMGVSMIYRQPVSDIIQERFFNSLLLMAVSWLISGIAGFAAGIIAAWKKDTWVDRLVGWYCYTMASTPAFWMGLLLVMVFSVWLGWLPVGLGVPAGVLAENVGWADHLRHMILPALTLSIVGIAPIALHTREKLIAVLASDYVLFARARGATGWRLLYRHGLRNIALPALTLQFASFSELFGGAVLAEQVFSYPGLGQATVESGLRGDVPLLMALVLCSSLFVFTGNSLADMLYRLVDPRIKESRRRLWSKS